MQKQHQVPFSAPLKKRNVLINLKAINIQESGVRRYGISHDLKILEACVMAGKLEFIDEIIFRFLSFDK